MHARESLTTRHPSHVHTWLFAGQSALALLLVGVCNVFWKCSCRHLQAYTSKRIEFCVLVCLHTATGHSLLAYALQLAPCTYTASGLKRKQTKVCV